LGFLLYEKNDENDIKIGGKKKLLQAVTHCTHAPKNMDDSTNNPC
jgi:hypothetical protein